MGAVFANAGYEAARVGGDSPEMDAQALRAKSVVLAVAAPHTKSGQYNTRVKIVADTAGNRGVRHLCVISTDPNALSIEYGHWWVTPEGEVVKWVEGIRIFNRAYDILKE